LVPACDAPASVVPATTAAGAATATLPRPTVDADLNAVDAARGAEVRAAVRGARECALARGAVAEADSDGVDPSVAVSASATAGA
jgi:hypothetical protein